MRIATYDEVDPEQVAQINKVCFGSWMVDPAQVQLVRKLDRRCSDYYGVYALEHGRAVSQVVVHHVETRTTSGIERVAAIAGVGSLPRSARRGFSTALLQKAHELSRERGIRLAFILTSESLVAYTMYTKLGYNALTTFQAALKRTQARQPKPAAVLKLVSFKPSDAPALDRVYSSMTADRLGFVVRQPSFLNMMVKTRRLSPRSIRIATSNGPVGYVISDKEHSILKIEELIGTEQRARDLMLDRLENDAHTSWVLCNGSCDQAWIAMLEARGYEVNPSWDRAMTACLDKTLDQKKVRDMYGLEDKRFFITSLDEF